MVVVVPVVVVVGVVVVVPSISFSKKDINMFAYV